MEAAFARIPAGELEGLRLRQVAEDVGIDRVHHHVAPKQELILAVAGYRTRQFWTDAFERPEPVDALHSHLAEICAQLHERPALFVVTSELDLQARRDPGVAKALAEGHTPSAAPRVIENLENLLFRGAPPWTS